MATLTIRNLDDELKARLRVNAALHGHSMEEEVRLILRRSLTGGSVETGLGQRVHQRFVALGDVNLALPARTDPPRAADLPE